MRVLLILAVCGTLTLTSANHHQKRHAEKSVGRPRRLRPVFLDREDRIEHVEEEVRKQRLDNASDMRTKQLMAEIGNIESRLETVEDSNVKLNWRLAKEEASFADSKQKFQTRIVGIEHESKVAHDWAWRLEMCFLAQAMVALILALSCWLCHCQSCSTACSANKEIVNTLKGDPNFTGDPNMELKKPHKLTACSAITCNAFKSANPNSKPHSLTARRNQFQCGTHPELKEKLRMRRNKLDGGNGSSPEVKEAEAPKQDSGLAGPSVGVPADQPKTCAYYSLAAESDSEEQPVMTTPRSAAFPAVFSEPQPIVAPDKTDSWWGSPVHTPGPSPRNPQK